MSKHHNTANDWRSGSKRRLIAELAEAGKTKREAYAALRPMVEDQQAPMIFSANVNGRRTPKPISLQLVELKNEIGRVYALLGRAATASWDSDEIEPDSQPTPDEEPEEEEEEEEEEEKDTPRAVGKDRVKSELKFFLAEARRIRKLCEDRAAGGAGSLDWISMRPAQAAAKLIPAGIPAAALLHAMTLHWKPEIRRNDAGVPDFDFTALSREIMESRDIDPTGKHELFGYVLVLAEERQPIMCIGPAGTGKSHLCKQVADYLFPGEDRYGETPMTPGATRGDLLGRMTANPDEPFILSQFAEVYSQGGVFNFEEIDASDPGMLLVLNNALAGSELFNSANGQRYKRHEDFIAMSTANTFGIGATKDYTGRDRLDAATIDRWRMGRVFLPLDEIVEEGILFGTI
jgi:AAA domain (dynein-related subfamily)